MKKSILMAAAALAAVTLTGCAGIATNNGAVAPINAVPNFYSDVSANAFIQPTVRKDFKVIKEVSAQGTLTSYFACVNTGDISYATLKKAALENAKEANDLIDVKMDYSMKNICGISTITVTLTGTAVKF